ncbi:hypothetical protein DOY81_009615, partial [Sarcophaga bullata]
MTTMMLMMMMMMMMIMMMIIIAVDVAFCFLVAITTTGIQAATLDNTLLAKYLCRTRPDNFKTLMPGSCSQYYECQKRQTIIKKCPQYFDSVKKQCVSTNPGCEETIPEPLSCTGPCCGISNGYAVDPQNQQIYYACKNNCVAATKTCPNGQMFDLVTKKCGKPKPHLCTSLRALQQEHILGCILLALAASTAQAATLDPPCTAITTTTVKAPCASAKAIEEVKQVDCQGKPDGFKFVSLTKCNEFFVCHKGIAMTISCGDKYYNALTGICDLPENT